MLEDMPAAGRETRLYGGLAAALAQLAAKQHGVFGLGQLQALGLTANAANKRVLAGQLFRVHRGVYALVPGSLLSREGRWMAAVLACGRGAALSHRSAAHLHGLRPTSRERIDVIIPGASARIVPGVEVHRSMRLTDHDVTTVDSIPVTTVARMILDLAAVVDQRAVERVIGEAVDREVFDLWAVTDQLTRNPKHPGTPIVRAALGPDRAGLTDADLEERFVAIWWPTGLPRPQTRYYIDPGDGGLLIRADFAWPQAKFDLETDGTRYHAPAHHRRRDYRRDQRLKRARWEVLRVDDDQLNDDPDDTVAIVWNSSPHGYPWTCDDRGREPARRCRSGRGRDPRDLPLRPWR